ncbi:MAG: acyltransferase family protein, partial [Marinicella sp.]
ALLVVFFHLVPQFGQANFALAPLMSFFAQFGYAGVDVFFVISGYVIWKSSQSNSGKSTPHFIYNRLTRIYLGYWPYFLLYLAVVYFFASGKLNNANLLGSFFLTEIGIHKLLIPIAWTLTYEMYFYLCFTVLMLLPKNLLPMMIKLLIVFIVLIQGYHILFNDIYTHANFPYIDFYLTFLTSPFCLEFLMGCLVAIFFEKNRIKHLKIPLLLAAVVLIAGLFYQQQYIMPEGLLAQGYYLPQRVMFWGTVSVLLVASVVELNKRGTILLPKMSHLLGGASYSIYLSHIPIIFLFSHLGFVTYFRNQLKLPDLGFLIIALCVIIYSVVHYLWIEKPLMQASKWVWLKVSTRTQESQA